MGLIVKRKPGRPKNETINTVSAEALIGGRRGRRSMPAVRIARNKFSQAQRRVASYEKSLRNDQVALAAAADRKSAAAIRGRIKATTSLLRVARKSLHQVAAELRQVLKAEAAKSRALAQARAVALYKAKLQTKLGADLERAVARFTSAWKKKRSKIMNRKLAVQLKKEAAKTRAAARKANAKARESVKRAETLAKARARKAATKAKAKARKLAAKAKVKARLVVGKAAKKARVAAVSARLGSRKKRSK